MTRPERIGAKRLLNALPALLVSLAAAACLLSPSLRVPGQRGGLRIADGFRPGRWDARFVVARGPASIRLPPEAARTTLSLSGPARVRIRGDGAERAFRLGNQPEPIDLTPPVGGPVLLDADAPIRLHEIRVARTSSLSWRRLATLGLFGAAGLALAWRIPGASLAGGALALAAAFFCLRGTLAGLFAAVMFDRLLPLACASALAACFVLPRLLPRGAVAAAASLRLPATFGALLSASCLAQVALFEQPLVAGDPAAYHEIGGRFRDALIGVRSADDFADAVQSLRPYGGLAVTGLAYGLLRAVRDQPLTIYFAHALAIGGCAFFLTRVAQRLGGARLAVVTGLLALSYGTFPVLAGIVQPEPFILLAWAFALDAMLLAIETRDERRAAASGLAFALGLALHPQGIWFLLLALALVLAPFAPALLAFGRGRLVRGFAIGLLPIVLTAAAGETYARPVTSVLDERHGFWAYTASFPLGFWLFLETDGWQGPMRIDETAYARAFHVAEESGTVSGTLDRLVFTARFVAEHAAGSLRTVLRNLHRLFHVPDNPPRRDFPLPYGLQVYWHRALVVLFLLGLALAFPGRAALAYVPFAMLCATYPLYHVFNKYALPATPFLMLGAAMALVRIVGERNARLLAALVAAGIGAALPPSMLAFMGMPPLAARGFVLMFHLGGLLAAFYAAGSTWARDTSARRLAAAALTLLVVPALAARWDDPDWRRFERTLDQPAEHEIALRPEEIEKLNAAREAYLVLDLQVADGNPNSLSLRFASGLVVPGEDLQPTMPTFGLATTRFQRDPRGFRQWWRVAWRPEMAGEGRVRLTLQGAPNARLFGSLDDGDASLDRGLSLGQWPYASVYRLMHDGEYRLAVDQPLGGLSRRSLYAGQALPGLWGIRLIGLAEEGSLARVETAPVPKAARAIVTAVWAKTSLQGPVMLETPVGSVVFSLQDRGAVVPLQAGEARFVPTGEGEAWLLLRMSAPAGGSLGLTLRPRQEMTSPPRFFEPQLRAAPPIPLDWTGSPYVPVVKIVESRTLPWQPAAVY